MKNRQVSVDIAYICSGKKKDCTKEGCYYKIHNGIRGGCMHTTNMKYAKNRPPKEPKKNPEWFDKFKVGDQIRYYEREEPK